MTWPLCCDTPDVSSHPSLIRFQGGFASLGKSWLIILPCTSTNLTSPPGSRHVAHVIDHSHGRSPAMAAMETRAADGSLSSSSFLHRLRLFCVHSVVNELRQDCQHGDHQFRGRFSFGQDLMHARAWIVSCKHSGPDIFQLLILTWLGDDRSDPPNTHP